MQSLKAAKPDVVGIVDSRSQLMTSRSSDIEAKVSVDFYDKTWATSVRRKGMTPRR